MRYDYKLNAYVLDYRDLKNYSKDYINNFKGRLIIESLSTKNMSTRTLENFTNPNVVFHVRGGYNKEKADYWNSLNEKNPNFKKGRYGISGVSYVEDSNIYSISEMKKIVGIMEKIEEDIIPQWSNAKKMLYIYDRLREEIIYHPRYENELSHDIRSLRGLISKKTVCAGYSIIFKEMMDRQHIPCEVVFGFVDKETADKTPDDTQHLWNIVNIGGRNIPIDLTWDSTIYRQGEKSELPNFADVESFRKQHFPHKTERIQDYGVLYGIKEKYVRKMLNSFQRKKKYTQSIMTVHTDDQKIVDVAQVGSAPIEGSKDKMYRYIVAERSKDNSHCNYRMVYSKNSFLLVYSLLQKNKISKDDYRVAAMKRMFSPDYIDKCLKTGSNYIGRAGFDKTNNSFKIERDAESLKNHRTNFRELVRRDGTSFLVGQTAKTRVIDNSVIHYGMVSEFDFKKRKLMEYKVCSEQDLLQNNSRCFVDDFLSFDRLEKKVYESGGYLGMIDDKGRIFENDRLSKFFDIKNPGDISEDDFVKPGYVENRSNYYGTVDFDTLKRVTESFVLKYDISNGADISIKNRTTGSELRDPKKRIIVGFSSIWLAAAGPKYMISDDIPGLTYAFNDGSHLVFDYIQRSCIKMIEETGEVDFSKLTEANFINETGRKYKYASDIFEKLTKVPGNRQIVQDFFNLQTEVYNNSFAARKAKGLFENDLLNTNLYSSDSIIKTSSDSAAIASDSIDMTVVDDDSLRDNTISSRHELDEMFSLEKSTSKSIENLGKGK